MKAAKFCYSGCTETVIFSPHSIMVPSMFAADLISTYSSIPHRLVSLYVDCFVHSCCNLRIN